MIIVCINICFYSKSPLPENFVCLNNRKNDFAAYKNANRPDKLCSDVLLLLGLEIIIMYTTVSFKLWLLIRFNN